MAMANDPVLVTGAAGFIGMHAARRLLEAGRAVVGIDNLNAYYDPGLKQARLNELAAFSNFHFEKSTLPTAPAWPRCSQRAASRPSFISPRKPACATRSSILMPMRMPISAAS